MRRTVVFILAILGTVLVFLQIALLIVAAGLKPGAPVIVFQALNVIICIAFAASDWVQFMRYL